MLRLTRNAKFGKIHPRSLYVLSSNSVSNRTTIPSERNWDPKEIYPNGPKQVRVTGITLRDGHQSLNGGMHRIDLLEKAAKLIDKIRPPTMKYPGHEEIGGGTTVDFPLRFKGEDPFRNMEIISSNLPNTPTSCLIRSDSLCGYNVNPRDVVHAFIKRYAKCGLDIFRNFDAYNNVENHATVAEAVIEAGKHYQAALTFTSHQDPTYFNTRWVADLAKKLAKLGAHSFCIKDMAGIASPANMKAWVSAIKDAVPELPIVIHSHYTTGFSPITYLLAIEAGASAVDCGISTLSGRSGHPAMEVFNQVLSDMGYDLGWNSKEALEAMKPVADLYREAHSNYEFCEMKMAGTVDYRVFTQGIPGGQISIMKNELERNGYGHLFDLVIEQIQRVRTQVGGVALVTPTSEHVARQSILNAMDGLKETTEKSKLWPGYSEMLRGCMGRPPMKMDVNLQKRALREWATNLIKTMTTVPNAPEGSSIEEQDRISKLQETKKDLFNRLNTVVPKLVELMWEKSMPIQDRREINDLENRIKQLTEIDSKRFSSQIEKSKQELEKLKKQQPSNIEELDNQYTNILRLNIDNKIYNEILKSTGLEKFINNKEINDDQAKQIIKAAMFVTVCPSSIISQNGMEIARKEVEDLANIRGKEFDLPPRNDPRFDELAILHCMFRHAQDIAKNWFIHHDTNPKFWDKHFPSSFPFNRPELPTTVPPVMYPYRTKVSDDIKKEKSILEWSDTELSRVFIQDMKKLLQVKEQLKSIEKYQPENEQRQKMQTRQSKEAKNKLENLEKAIRAKLKTSFYNTKSHEAGFQIDVDSSIELNWNKLQNIKF